MAPTPAPCPESAAESKVTNDFPPGYQKEPYIMETTSNKTLRQVVDLIADGYIAADKRNRVLSYNAALERMFPGSGRIAPGEDVLAFFERNFSGVSRDSIKAAIEQAASPGGTEPIELKSSDGTTEPIELKSSDGTYINVEIAPVTKRSIYDGSIFLFKDITRAKQLRAAHERSMLILDSTPLACRLWNKDHEVIELNKASVKLFRAKDEQQILDDYFAISPEYQPDGQSSVDKTHRILSEVLEQGPRVFEWMHKTLDGEPLPTEITLIPLDFDGETFVAGYTRDLREQVKMLQEIQDTSHKLEEALTDAQNANNAKSDFLAKMSHEMRTPLNAVIGLSSLVLDAGRLYDDDMSLLEQVYNAGTTLLGTVNDILDISKIEAGRLELIEAEYDVPSLINDTVTQNVLRIGEKPIEFELDVDESVLARLYGDELRIKQIINNLLSNAIKYTDRGMAKLRVRTEPENGAVHFTAQVSDTGRGIKPENIDELFSAYSQADTGANRMIEGTGLGLTITKKLAEMMGGSVSVESEYGKGSVFTAEFTQRPVSSQTIGGEVVESLKSFRYSDNRRELNTNREHVKLPHARVLVVDDNVTNLDVAKGLMKPYEMRVDCVTSGQQAIDAIRSETVKYNAVFMDHMMPGLDGIETAKLIREIDTEYTRNIPIIMLTANAIVGNEEMFLREGFQAFLSKPIDTSRLDEVIRRWVKSRRSETPRQIKKPAGDGDYPDFFSADERRNIMSRRSGIDRRKANMQFAGLDIDKGIERFNGDREVYFRVIHTYVTHTRQLLDSIETVDAGNLKDYAITVHGIRGSSRGIFADMIGNAAENLEVAARSGDLSYITTHNGTFLSAAWKLIFDLEDLLANVNSGVPKPIMDKPDEGTLVKLREACEVYNMDGVDDAMSQLEKYRYKYDGDLAAWLVENIKLMNFKEIVERLSGD